MRNYTRRMAGLRDRARAAASEFRREAERIDREDQFPPALLELLWESGFLSLVAPRAAGGLGAGLVEASVVVEELSRGSGAAGLLTLLQALGMTAVMESGENKRADELLARLVERREVCAFALSEPEPAAGEKQRVTSARKVRSEYLLTGRKTFVSGVRDADLIIVFAVTGPKLPLKKALSAFAVPTGTTGLLPGRELPKAGLRGVPAAELTLENVRLGAAARIGKQGEGYGLARRSIVRCLPLVAALSAGILREALDQMVERARSRVEAPSVFSEFRAVELVLAEMAAGLDVARAMFWSAAGALEEEAPEAERLAREAKWLATEAAVSGVDQAVGLVGVEGAIRGSRLERLSRDARAAQIILGPNHLHRLEAARKLLSGR